MKTSEMIGPALDRAVAKCEGVAFSSMPSSKHYFSPSTVWAHGGPIIEREKIGSLHEARGVWSASTKWDDPAKVFYGETNLIAAMRCYVASKMGDEVVVEELEDLL